MKNAYRHRLRQRAAALIELMISTAIMGITGGIIYYILNTGMILFAKNTAINIAHQEARVAVLQMEQDLHSAISIPTLTDASKTAVAGVGPAAGISFQLFGGGPFKVTSSTTGYLTGQNQITINVTQADGSNYTPVVGQRLIIPTHQIELDITAVSSGSSDRTLTLASNLPVAVYTKLGQSPNVQDVNVVCFITDRVYYVVSGSQLLYYGRKSSTAKVMANDLTTATPFSIPATPLGAPYNRFVAAINLSTADTSTSNRKFRAANMFLNAMEPYRARLCIYQ